MSARTFHCLTVLALLAALAPRCLAHAADVPATARPHIVLIYADDIGYGDFSCYGATRVQTPNIDRAARQGLRFLDAHSTSATCTPSRYALLTGQYPWRRQGTGILPGDAKLIIEPGRQTLASLLKGAGYRCGVVGKWHLGLGQGNLDWNGTIKPGPLEIGFDECFLMPATGDRVPCVYVENHHVVGLDPADPIQVRFGQKIGNEPTGKENPELLTMRPSHGHDHTIVNGVSRIGYMSGGHAARWKDETMADVFVDRARQFVDRHLAERPQDPFFLFFSTHDAHVPRLPHPRFRGKSQMGPRGDALLEFDDSVGAILDLLDKHGIVDNTLLIITSDNGPVIDDGYQDDAVAKLGDHRAAGPFRGGKYSNFEGGTRIPMIVRWPGRVRTGESSALICHIDLIASLAALVKQPVEPTASDSENVLGALLGTSNEGRQTLVEHAGVLALRQGSWKLIEAGRGPRRNANTNTELGNDPAPQLYHLEQDPGEMHNVAAQHPDKVAELLKLLREVRMAR